MSVCHTPVLCLNDLTNLKTFLTSGNPTSIVFYPLHQYPFTQFHGEPHHMGRKINEGWEILRFLTEIAVYLGNSAR